MNILDIPTVVKGHYTVALEHCKNNGLSHKPTILQAVILTIKDMVLNYTIVDRTNGAYLVYQKNYMNTLGIETALMIREYVPIENRGKGVLKNMIKKIPIDIVMEIRDGQIRNTHGKKLVGTIYTISKNIQ